MFYMRIFIAIWVYSQLKRHLKRFAALKLAPVLPPPKPLYNVSSEVSVIVPTIDADDTFIEALTTWISNKPLEIIIVTTAAGYDKTRNIVNEALKTLKSRKATKVKVLSIPLPGKRKQLAYGIQQAKGSITVLCDDDIFWPPTLLSSILACFETPRVGGVGTQQRARLPADAKASFWQILAKRRLKERNIYICSMNYLDGGVTCLSGRTAGYRSVILKDPAFLHSFTNDYWNGKYLLDSGDDTFITRWLYSTGWEIKIQADPNAEIETVVSNSPKYLKQLLRWARNTKHSYLRCLTGIPGFWRNHPFLAFTMIEALLQPLTSSLYIYLVVRSIRESKTACAVITIYYFLIKFHHFVSAQEQGNLALRFLGLLPFDGALYIPLNLYAFVTLNKTAWGSRNVIETN